MPLWTTLIVAAVGAAVWAWRLRPLSARRRTREPAASGPVDVSIVIPARNEAHNLPALLASLGELTMRPREILVVDDHSIDATAEVAERFGARVLTAPPLPQGWTGKAWACAYGAAHATGAFVLFTDADTIHAPASLARAVARMRSRAADLVTVVPTHRTAALWERLQGVFHLLLLVATRAGARDVESAGARNSRGWAAGHYLLFRRATYDAIGGHAVVADRVAEDLALAAEVRRAGHVATTMFAPRLVIARMYPEGLRGFVAGWRRNFRDGLEAAGVTGFVEVFVVLWWLLSVPLDLTRALAASDWTSAGVLGVVYAATALDVGRRQRALGAFPAWSALVYPIFAVVFVLVTSLAAIDRLLGRPIRWKDREIVRMRRAAPRG